MPDPLLAYLDRVEAELRHAIQVGDSTAIDHLGAILDAADSASRDTSERGTATGS